MFGWRIWNTLNTTSYQYYSIEQVLYEMTMRDSKEKDWLADYSNQVRIMFLDRHDKISRLIWRFPYSLEQYSQFGTKSFKSWTGGVRWYHLSISSLRLWHGYTIWSIWLHLNQLRSRCNDWNTTCWTFGHETPIKGNRPVWKAIEWLGYTKYLRVSTQNPTNAHQTPLWHSDQSKTGRGNFRGSNPYKLKMDLIAGVWSEIERCFWRNRGLNTPGLKWPEF